MGNPNYLENSLVHSSTNQNAGRDTVAAKVVDIINHAIVVSNEDKLGNGRIKVRIFNIDSPEIPDLDLPWAYPMMPSFSRTIPKIGEHVIVIFTNPWNWGSTRYYLGPMQSGETISGEDYLTSAKNLEIPEMK